MRKMHVGWKTVVMMEMVFLFIVFGILYYYSSPEQISPASGLVVRDFDLQFEVVHAKEVELSKTPDFEEIVLVEKGKDLTLPPGIYYWRAVSFLRKSSVRNFTIESSLVLRIEDGEVMKMFNEGNVAANVSGSGENKIVAIDSWEDFGNNDSVYEGREA